MVLLDVSLARVVVGQDQLAEGKLESRQREQHDAERTNLLSDNGHHSPNNTMTQVATLSRSRRQKRAVDASGSKVIPKYSRDVAIFGMSVRFDNEKKRVDYTGDAVEILEGLEVTLVFYGHFIKGTKVRLNDNGHKCDDETKGEEKSVEVI